MTTGIRTSNPWGFNKGRSSKFRVVSQVQQTPEEDQRTYQPKPCGNSNKDEDNNPQTFNDKNSSIEVQSMYYTAPADWASVN